MIMCCGAPVENQVPPLASCSLFLESGQTLEFRLKIVRRTILNVLFNLPIFVQSDLYILLLDYPFSLRRPSDIAHLTQRHRRLKWIGHSNTWADVLAISPRPLFVEPRPVGRFHTGVYRQLPSLSANAQVHRLCEFELSAAASILPSYMRKSHSRWLTTAVSVYKGTYLSTQGKSRPNGFRAPCRHDGSTR